MRPNSTDLNIGRTSSALHRGPRKTGRSAPSLSKGDRGPSFLISGWWGLKRNLQQRSTGWRREIPGTWRKKVGYQAPICIPCCCLPQETKLRWKARSSQEQALARWEQKVKEKRKCSEGIPKLGLAGCAKPCDEALSWKFCWEEECSCDTMNKSYLIVANRTRICGLLTDHLLHPVSLCFSCYSDSEHLTLVKRCHGVPCPHCWFEKLCYSSAGSPNGPLSLDAVAQEAKAQPSANMVVSEALWLQICSHNSSLNLWKEANRCPTVQGVVCCGFSWGNHMTNLYKLIKIFLSLIS